MDSSSFYFLPTIGMNPPFVLFPTNFHPTLLSVEHHMSGKALGKTRKLMQGDWRCSGRFMWCDLLRRWVRVSPAMGYEGQTRFQPLGRGWKSRLWLEYHMMCSFKYNWLFIFQFFWKGRMFNLILPLLCNIHKCLQIVTKIRNRFIKTITLLVNMC